MSQNRKYSVEADNSKLESRTEVITYLLTMLDNGTDTEQQCIMDILQLAANKIKTHNFDVTAKAAGSTVKVLGCSLPDKRLLSYQKNYLNDVYNSGSPAEKQLVTWCIDNAMLKVSSCTGSGSDLAARKVSDEIVLEYAKEKKVSVAEAIRFFEQILNISFNVVCDSVLSGLDAFCKTKNAGSIKAVKEVKKPSKKLTFEDLFEQYERWLM